jgi:hypothetical protein
MVNDNIERKKENRNNSKNKNPTIIKERTNKQTKIKYQEKNQQKTSRFRKNRISVLV